MNGPTQILDLGQGFLRPITAQHGSARAVSIALPGAVGPVQTPGSGEVFSQALAVAQGAEALDTIPHAKLSVDTQLETPDAPAGIMAAPVVDTEAVTALLGITPQSQAASELVLAENNNNSPIELIGDGEVEMMLAFAQKAVSDSLPVAQITFAAGAVDALVAGSDATFVSDSEVENILAFAQQLVQRPAAQIASATLPEGEPQVRATTLTTPTPVPPHFDIPPYTTATIGLLGQDVTLSTPSAFKNLPQQSAPSVNGLAAPIGSLSVDMQQIEATDILPAPKAQTTVNIFDSAPRQMAPVAHLSPEIAQQASLAQNTTDPDPTAIVSAMTAAPAQTAVRKTNPLRAPMTTAAPEGLTISDGIGLANKAMGTQDTVLQSKARLPDTLARETTAPLPNEADRRPAGEAPVMTSPTVATVTTGTSTPITPTPQGPMQQSAMAGAMLDVQRQGWTKTLVNRAAQSVQAGGTLTLSILPQHLGQITLKLSEGRKGMELRITAEVASTASMLRSVETQIAGAFDEAGLKLASFSANTGGQGQGGDTPNERPDRTGTAAANTTTDETTQPVADTSSLISIIA